VKGVTDMQKVLIVGFVLFLFFVGVAIGTSIAIAKNSSSLNEDRVHSHPIGCS